MKYSLFAPIPRCERIASTEYSFSLLPELVFSSLLMTSSSSSLFVSISLISSESLLCWDAVVATTEEELFRLRYCCCWSAELLSSRNALLEESILIRYRIFLFRLSLTHTQMSNAWEDWQWCAIVIQRKETNLQYIMIIFVFLLMKINRLSLKHLPPSPHTHSWWSFWTNFKKDKFHLIRHIPNSTTLFFCLLSKLFEFFLKFVCKWWFALSSSFCCTSPHDTLS